MLIKGDARQIPLRDACVQCVVTSPPYWGLRDYGSPGQIGLESTPDAYVAAIVAVFAEVRRVLKADGTAWLNLGDSYAGSWGARGRGNDTNAPRPDLELKYGTGAPNRAVFRPGNPEKNQGNSNRDGLGPEPGCKAKDLVGIPWRVAFALQADGWYLRSDIIWSKPNPMPESVTDRPTKAHEYIFLLTKSERYFYDAEAIAEPVSDAMREQLRQGYNGSATKDYAAAGAQDPSAVKSRILSRSGNKARKFRVDHGGVEGSLSHQGFGVPWEGWTRNKRSVWTVATQPYAGAHFATFPEALIEPCILAGSRANDLVLDPFIGSGTTGSVCDRLMRRWVGLDLSYQDLALTRTQQRGLRLTEQTA